MAGVTVEDCIDKVDNQFDLIIIAAHRTRQLSSGIKPLVERKENKNPVISLREIAESKINPDDMLKQVTQSHRSHVVVDAEEDNLDHLLTPNIVPDTPNIKP